MSLDFFWNRYAHFVDCAHKSLGRDMTDNEDLMLFTNFLRISLGLNPIPDTSIFHKKRSAHLKRRLLDMI